MSVEAWWTSMAMDKVTGLIAVPAMVWTTVVGIAGLLSLGFGIFWLFNKQARLKHIAELRKRLDELEPSDPEYSAVRALYTSMVIDAERWGFFRSDTTSGNHEESIGQFVGGHAGDGNADGGHH